MILLTPIFHHLILQVNDVTIIYRSGSNYKRVYHLVFTECAVQLFQITKLKGEYLSGVFHGHAHVGV